MVHEGRRAKHKEVKIMQSNNNGQTEEENTEERTEEKTAETTRQKRKRYEVDQVPIESVKKILTAERMELFVDELGDHLLALYRQLTFTENFDSFTASNFLRVNPNLKKESSDAKAA